MTIILTSLALLVCSAIVSGLPYTNIPQATLQTGSWNVQNFKSLVTFGDSYTDESRAWYFNDHGGSPPPSGWIEPINNATYTGGYVWPRYVNWYSGANTYNYAVSGAVCARAITAHKGVGIQEYEIGAFLADKAFNLNGKPFLEIPPDQTVYAIWIGTNELGVNGFLTNEEESGKTVDDYVECVYKTLDQIYSAGGRRFVLMNNVPLDLVPLYSAPSHGGLSWSKFWTNKPADVAGIAKQIGQLVGMANKGFKSKAEAIMTEGKRLPEAQLALFDTWSLFHAMDSNPSTYLNGTAPLNVTSSVMQCFQNGECTRSSSPDSFMWFDDLHPSEQADRVVAKEFLKVISGKSKFATYWPKL